MNWKKDGWQLGSRVFIVSDSMFMNHKNTEAGEVIHVGTKILKVKIRQGIVLTFRDSIQTIGHIASFGYVYHVFKSEQHYNDYIEKKKYRKKIEKLAEKAIKVLDTCELEIMISMAKKHKEWEKENGEINGETNS